MNTMPIEQIRLLPMAEKEFRDKAEIDVFFGGTLTTEPGLKRNNDNGKYWYYKHTISSDNEGKRLDDTARIFVLFRYKGKIVACGEMCGQKSEGQMEPGYNGYYQFDMDTVKLFKHPVGIDEFKSIVPDIQKFAQGAQIIDMKYLEAVLRMALRCVYS